MRKVYNSIIVKNFKEAPIDTPEQKATQETYIRSLFEKFGGIQSVFVKNSEPKKMKEEQDPTERRQIAFVCFENPETAAKAVEEMNTKEIEDGKKLYVSEALKKNQLAKEIFKFKNSKKRCNLFVKGFAPDTSKEDLMQYFVQLSEKGEDSIESLKLEMEKNDPTKAKYAFICFKTPDEANSVKMKAGTTPLKGQKLYITNYELKEVRDIQIAEIRDKADYQNHLKPTMANTGSIEQFVQKPEVLQTLLFLMDVMNNQGGNKGGMRGQRPPFQN